MRPRTTSSAGGSGKPRNSKNRRSLRRWCRNTSSTVIDLRCGRPRQIRRVERRPSRGCLIRFAGIGLEDMAAEGHSRTRHFGDGHNRLLLSETGQTRRVASAGGFGGHGFSGLDRTQRGLRRREMETAFRRPCRGSVIGNPGWRGTWFSSRPAIPDPGKGLGSHLSQAANRARIAPAKSRRFHTAKASD